MTFFLVLSKVCHSLSWHILSSPKYRVLKIFYDKVWQSMTKFKNGFFKNGVFLTFSKEIIAWFNNLFCLNELWISSPRAPPRTNKFGAVYRLPHISTPLLTNQVWHIKNDFVITAWLVAKTKACLGGRATPTRQERKHIAPSTN